MLQHTFGFGFHQQLNSDQPLSPCEACDPKKKKKTLILLTNKCSKSVTAIKKKPLNPSNLALICCFLISLPAYQAFQQALRAILQLAGHLYG